MYGRSGESLYGEPFRGTRNPVERYCVRRCHPDLHKIRDPGLRPRFAASCRSGVRPPAHLSTVDSLSVARAQRGGPPGAWGPGVETLPPGYVSCTSDASDERMVPATDQ